MSKNKPHKSIQRNPKSSETISTSDTLKLTAEEAADLAKREAAIEAEAAGSDLIIGQELLAISEPPRRYHRKIGFDRIEEYALSRFKTAVGTAHSHVYRLLKLAKAKRDRDAMFPNGDTEDVIPWDCEGTVRTLCEKQGTPEFADCVDAVGLMVHRLQEEAAAQDKDVRISGSKIERAVNDATIAHRIAQHNIRPTSKRELAENFHVSRVEGGLTFIADGECDFVMSSFPYGCGMDYLSHGEPVFNDKCNLDELLDKYAKWIKKIERITNPHHGRILLNTADIYINPKDTTQENVVYLDQEIDQIIRSTTDFKRYAKIFWDKSPRNAATSKHGSVATYSCPAVERRAEILLVYFRGSRQRPHDPQRRDMDAAEFMSELKMNLWTVPTERRSGPHPCPYPVKLCERAIRFFTAPPGPNGEVDSVADVFGGGGNLAIAAVRHGRRFIYNDASQEYAEYAMEQVTEEIKQMEKERKRRKS